QSLVSIARGPTPQPFLMLIGSAHPGIAVRIERDERVVDEGIFLLAFDVGQMLAAARAELHRQRPGSGRSHVGRRSRSIAKHIGMPLETAPNTPRRSCPLVDLGVAVVIESITDFIRWSAASATAAASASAVRARPLATAAARGGTPAASTGTGATSGSRISAPARTSNPACAPRNSAVSG